MAAGDGLQDAKNTNPARKASTLFRIGVSQGRECFRITCINAMLLFLFLFSRLLCRGPFPNWNTYVEIKGSVFYVRRRVTDLDID